MALDSEFSAALRILYQDESCAVVDKPSGMIVHRGWANDDQDLMRRTRDALGRYVYPLHRLDRGASGAVLFALNEPAARSLNRAFAAGEIEKRYLALTRGHPPEQGLVDHPIPRAPGEERVSAQTEYRRLGVFERYALVLALPKTGRLHQIRRHLKHLSCPLIGDVRYGKGEHNRLFRERYGFERLALHAAALRFVHPVTEQSVTVRAPLLGSFEHCLETLGLGIPARAAIAADFPDRRPA
ncbi:MAG TPA: pseudouridine synthase [Polyangiaceae bacterium]|jgi:tRNA pseudouridine65 synthase|nr:pseudouridine synthase [Polyangiaceae bacterium]